jgi:hypothetical protein
MRTAIPLALAACGAILYFAVDGSAAGVPVNLIGAAGRRRPGQRRDVLRPSARAAPTGSRFSGSVMIAAAAETPGDRSRESG